MFSRTRGTTRRSHAALGLGLVAATALGCGYIDTPPAVDPAHANPHDNALERAVVQALASDPLVEPRRLSVRSHHGIIKLTGQVTNLLARKRTQARVEATRGVLGVVNLIEVKPVLVRSDALLQGTLEEALRTYPPTADSAVDVSVVEGRATLSGTVDSAGTVQLIQLIAEGTDGIRTVSNRLAVDEHASRSDQAMRAEIEAKLGWDPWLDASLMRVNVDQARVALSGTVGRSEERSRAVANAWVRGVKQVDAQNVAVKAWARDSNRRVSKPTHLPKSAVEQAVRLALYYDPRVPAQSVEVELFEETVVLRGVVPSVEAKRAAAEDAQSAAGVTAVRNEVVVEGAPRADQAEEQPR